MSASLTFYTVCLIFTLGRFVKLGEKGNERATEDGAVDLGEGYR